MIERISAVEARRIALAASGLASARPARPERPHVRRVIQRLGMLQLDSVSVLARAHYLPLFSRLGAYDRALLDEAAWGRRPKPSEHGLFEYWAHEASLLPVATQPLLRWRMAKAERLEGIYGELAKFAVERRPFIAAVLHRISAEGALSASDFEGPRGSGGWWGWSEPKRALEWLFWSGQVTTATRRGFERRYDLPIRVLPASILAVPTPEPAEAQRRLLEIAARALGVATAADLRDYFRLSPADAPIIDLIEAGILLPVTVAGWSRPAFLHRDARRPRRVEACALVSPFDPLMWDRTRTERLFGFRYRLEIYTPAHKRQHGYYVLPFVLGDRIVARVDLKAERALGSLQVLSVHSEPGAPLQTAERLSAELRVMAGWLGLERVEVRPTGDLARLLCGPCNRGEVQALEVDKSFSLAGTTADRRIP